MSAGKNGYQPTFFCQLVYGSPTFVKESVEKPDQAAIMSGGKSEKDRYASAITS
jgi:hypothetical protein